MQTNIDNLKNISKSNENDICYNKNNIPNIKNIPVVKIVIKYTKNECLNEKNNKITISEEKNNLKKEKKVTFSDTNFVFCYEKDKKNIFDISSDEESSDEEDWSRY